MRHTFHSLYFHGGSFCSPCCVQNCEPIFYLSFGDLYLNWCRTILNEVIRPEVILRGGREDEIRQRTNLHDYPVFKVNGFGKCEYKGIKC